MTWYSTTSRQLQVFFNLFVLLVIATLPMSCSDRTAPAQQMPVAQEPTRPNIVLLLFDDAGYSDLSAFGGEVQTPNIERIVKEGMTVKRFYTASRCSPTRAGILSGRYPHDVGMADLDFPLYKTEFKAYQAQLPLSMPLVSELLQEAGYRTYLQGKWHLGDIPRTDVPRTDVPGADVPGADAAAEAMTPPNRRGFDEFIGFVWGMAEPYPNWMTRPYQHNQDFFKYEAGWYAIERLNDAMLKELKLQFQRESDTPFFVYFASQSPHEPLQAPQGLIDKYRKIYERPLEDIWQERVSRMRQMGLFPPQAVAPAPQFTSAESEGIRAASAIRAAMIESTDAEFGKLLQLLEESGKLDNTLIIVASDNGASTTTAKLTNAPYKGAKGVLDEGGTLSPLVARWPAGKIKANGTTDDMATYLDLMPTFLHIAGVDYPAKWHDGTPLGPLPGRNLIPLLRGEHLPPPEDFYWNLNGHSAVLHQGRWKLLINSAYDEEQERNNAPPKLALYDLLADPAETKNLAGTEKDLAASLLANYQEWATQHGAVPFYQVLDAYRKNAAGRVKRKGGGKAKQ
jgi:arylsulfatase A-like enzyme